MALVEANRVFTEDVENCPDGRAVMVPDARKWERISINVMRSSVCTSPRDGGVCKNKWNLVMQEFKRIVDFHARSGNNELSYWTLTPQRRKSENLPRVFHEDIFIHLHTWVGKRPTITPPHTRDL